MKNIVSYSDVLLLDNVDEKRLDNMFNYLDKFYPNELSDYQVGEILYNIYALRRIKDGVLIYKYFKDSKPITKEGLANPYADLVNIKLDYRPKDIDYKDKDNKNWREIVRLVDIAYSKDVV